MKVVNKPVEIIALATGTGALTPLRLRLNMNDENRVVQVNHVITQGEEKIAGKRIRTFRCQSIIDDVEKVYELRFELDTCKWVLFKI